jgi:S-adenosylmethionine:tRNA ribosyltransferase-isomerase
MRLESTLQKDDFIYDLPHHLIAQKPVKKRDRSRLLVLNRHLNTIEHRVFADIADYFNAGDVLVLNDVRVVPARLYAKRSSGGFVEILILDGHRIDSRRTVLLKPARRIKVGEHLFLNGGKSLTVVQRNDKRFTLQMNGTDDWKNALEEEGVMPLPPYIKRMRSHNEMEEMDKHRYQTVYALNSGAVAAPTAGLHFSKELLGQLKQKGIIVVTLTLWVGWGTFKPVEHRYVTDHRMDPEVYSIPEETVNAVCGAKKDNRRVIAVGTTSTRALESWAASPLFQKPVDQAEAELFITPGYKFQILDAMITNFHLPASTLIMLISAFAGRDRVLDAYNLAVRMKYRFYSYGDAMLIL